MTSDNSISLSADSPAESSEIGLEQQIRFKSEDGQLLLLLPPEVDAPEATANPVWNDIWLQINQRLNAGEKFWQPETIVHLIAHNRLLDARQLQEIHDALAEAQLRLKRVSTSRRQTAVAAATAGYSVEQQSSGNHLSQSASEVGQALADPLYLQTTVRSGVEIRHPGSVIVVGDTNPGSSIVAEGDILVWGRLRGVAHAGAKGNSRCLIMALQMEPTQIRIAGFVARPPEPPTEIFPEVAYVATDGIRLTKAASFSRNLLTLQPKR
ncbi:septum site-determining protein MinC [Leptolyngbya sp. 'hensonii']|uniref:septum site-determining protein MinC n=1 Tax=Leptolyngbya sp. 'hensonii' TaxID=1922337 RepID=UPI0009501E76|nr:septum site-determining protein MinC [Leptolyngbya sp. 'hensonii']OLP15656.1 septum site-determining protein MinC [Leptolyngbya sp. 'hensonii']